MSIELADPSLSWTRKLKDGGLKLCDFMVLDGDENDDPEAVKVAASFKTRFLKPLTQKLAVERGKQKERRAEIEKIRLTKLASTALQNESSRQNMFDLTVVHEAYIGEFRERENCQPLLGPT